MNEAARLGAKDTVAATPNGLDRNEQVTSATDLAIFFREALKNPDIAKIFQTKKLDAQTINGRLIHLYNHNKMLQLNYPGHLGAKTGTTSMVSKNSGVGIQNARKPHADRCAHAIRLDDGAGASRSMTGVLPTRRRSSLWGSCRLSDRGLR